MAVTANEGPVGPDDCPDLGRLEAAPLAPEVQQHVDGCKICTLVIGVIAERQLADQCERFELMLAARDSLNAAASNLLDRHLAGCEICRGISETLAPFDTDGDHTSLPDIDPKAYTLGIEFGRGGMGRVLEARDLRVGRDVVVKELLGRSPHNAARFEREARVTARLQHPGIVPIYEIGKWPDGTPFYTMRMIDGETLRSAIEKASTLPARLALLPRLIAACEAVAFAHSKQVIHRDLTPSNIMLGSYGETIVIDWGLARDRTTAEDDEVLESDPGDGHSDRLTGLGQAMGTPAYIPPEQAYGRDVDTRADVYSLGAILYQLLAGVPPFRGSAADVLREVRSTPPPSIATAAPGSPPALVSIVERAMQRMPEARFPSALELAEELKRFQTGQLVETHVYSRIELVKRFVRRHRGALVASGLALAILGVVTVFYVRGIIRSDREARETVRELLFEKGRIELLAGDHVRALAYLHEASSQGKTSPELELLLGNAAANLVALQDTLDCRGDDRYLELSHDGTLLGVACHDRARVWRIKADGKILDRPVPVATLEVPGRHGGFDNLTFSRDDKLLATWGAEGIARLWKVEALATPTVVREFRHAQPGKSPDRITFTTFTTDHQRIATTGVDGFAMVWNIETGREERTIDGAAGQLIRPLFGTLTPDDKLVTLTFSGIGAKYDALTGEKLGSFEHGSLVAGGEASPDGKRAVSCGRDGTAKVLDLATKTLVADLEGHTDWVWRCVFDASGTRVLTSSHDGTSKVWQLADVDGRESSASHGARLIATAHHGDLVWIGRFSPDGSRFVTISPGKNMKVWDSSSGALLATYTSRGKDARFLPDNRLAALTGDGRVHLWSAVSTRLAALGPAHRPSLAKATFAATRDAACIVTDGTEGIALWKPSGERLAPQFALHAPIATAAHRVAGIYLDASVDRAETSWGIGVVEPSGASRKLVIETAKDPRLPSELQLSDDGHRIALIWPDREVEIWDLQRGARIATLTTPRRPGDRSRALLDASGTRAVVWLERENPERTQTVIASPLVIWEVASARATQTLGALDARPIGFALGGRRLVVAEKVGSDAPLAAIWDVEANRAVRSQNDVDSAATIDPTGRWVTTIDREREVTVWNAETGAIRSKFGGELLQGVQANGDGTLVVAVAEYGRAVVILSALDGRELARHQIEHDRAQVTTESFRAPPSVVWWTPDSSQIANIARGFATWRATNPHGPAKIAELVRRHVPWRIENGRLEMIRNGRIAGQVTRAGEPVANATVEVQIRRPADISDKPVNWDSMKALTLSRRTVTDASGRFAVDHLSRGDFEYRLTVTSGATTKSQFAEPDAEEIDVSLD
jgi:WD40 repeat protein